MARNSSSDLALLGVVAVAATGYALLYSFSKSLGLSLSAGGALAVGLALATAVLIGSWMFFGSQWRRYWMPVVAVCYCIAFLPALNEWGAGGLAPEIYTLPSFTKPWWATGWGQTAGAAVAAGIAWVLAWVLDGGE